MISMRSPVFGNMSHENTTQKHNPIEFISYSLVLISPIPMKPAPAKAPEANGLEDLGRATLRIVHDLKNQLNGLKLYATFLRKCLERENRSQEEHETVAKLIAGLDRAARDMSALVRYARPLELRFQADADLGKIILSAVRDPVYRVSGALSEPLASEIEVGSLVGAFDPHVLAEALSALTREALGGAGSRKSHTVSLHVHRVETNASPEALIEWRGLRRRTQASASQTFDSEGSVYWAFAAKVIEAHGGRLESYPDVIRVSLPLSK